MIPLSYKFKIFLDFINNFLILIKNFFKLVLKNNYYYVFYSENHNYQSYYISLIYQLIKKDKSILYLSSDKEDFIRDSSITNLYVGNNFLRYFAFAIINAKYFFLTTTDLNKNELKKNKNVTNYVYIFHSVNSITNAYTKSAFEEYDIICCVGEYHLKEFDPKNNKKYSNKILLQTGYYYFDYIYEKKKKCKNAKEDPNIVLVAPSWNYSSKNLLELYTIRLIDQLLLKKFKVIFRPHQEHFKRNKKIINEIYKKFYHDKNFIFDNEPSNFQSLLTSSYLITDYSGIAHEFIFLFKKPTLYFKDLFKIHNTNQKNLNGDSIEEKIFQKFGFPISDKNISNIDLIIKESKASFLNKNELLDEFADKNFYNFKQSSEASVHFFK